MPTTDVWSDPEFRASVEYLSAAPGPAPRESPQCQEVEDLARRAGDEPKEVATRVGRAWFQEAALVVTDSVLARDRTALERLDRLLRRVHRLLAQAAAADPGAAEIPRAEAWLQMTMEFIRAGLERVAPAAVAAEVAGTLHEGFLRIVAENPRANSRQIGKLLGRNRRGSSPMDEGQLSRIGKKLRGQGLVFAVRGQGGLAWELTPRGRLVVDRLGHDADTGAATMTPVAAHADGIVFAESTT